MIKKGRRLKPAVHIQGYFSGSDGWSRHAREFANALSPYVSLTVQDWGDEKFHNSAYSRAVKWIFDNVFRKNPAYGIAIGPVERMSGIIGDKRAAYIVWETSIIPPSKLEYLENTDQIWTPSQWGRHLLARNGISESRIKVVPEGVDPERFYPIEDKAGPEDSIFRFLCIGKWEERKGVKDLIHAYCETFYENDPVELLLHCQNPFVDGFSNKVIEDYIRTRYSKHPKITLTGPVSDDELVKLYNRANIFVLPTKSEGWGLPIMEAMSCGLPVIVTDYSAHTDYTSPDTAYMIHVKEMIKVKDLVFFGDGEEYGEWAQPDLEHLGEIMLHVANHADEVKAKGSRARDEVIMNWTWDAAAKKGLDALGYGFTQPE